MAKSGRKRKRAEKSKTQLKKSIKLPKGTNVTKAEVFTKTIKVIDQLRTNDDAATLESGKITRKKLGIKDLMSKLANSGTSTRCEGLEGLNELVKAHPDLSSEYLSKLLPALISLTTDRESKIRTLSRPLVSLILKQVKPDQVEPLYNSVCALLCCGLSHINSDIQLDSLKLLDDIVSALPQLAVAKYDALLPNCLDQVSMKMKTKSTTNVNQNKRSLTVNMSEKVTALEWRTTVLKRVEVILSLVLSDAIAKANVDRMIVKNADQDFYMNLITDQRNEENNCLSLNQIELACRSYRFGKQNVSNANNKVQGFKMEMFIQGMIPILVETWIEAVGTKSSKQRGQNENHVKSEVGSTLAVIFMLLKTCSRLLTTDQDRDNDNALEEFCNSTLSGLTTETVSNWTKCLRQIAVDRCV